MSDLMSPMGEPVGRNPRLRVLPMPDARPLLVLDRWARRGDVRPTPDLGVPILVFETEIDIEGDW
jgi:hypothetical protein